MWSKNYRRLLAHLLADRPFHPFIESPDRQAHQSEWRAFIAAHSSTPPASTREAESFHDHWHVCHHILRELVDDDDAVLDMLWVWLPQYQGPDLCLYRGENADRLNAGRVGLAWTDDAATARTFASGLNAVGAGGALLRASVPASAIISGPSKHSLYLQESEYTVDPRRLDTFTVVETFSAII